MREARIILPDGFPTAQAWLEGALIDTFGGFTRLAIEGAWRSPEGLIFKEPGSAYDIAMEGGLTDHWRLQGIARSLLARTTEAAIYVRGPDGTVSFIDAAGNVPAVA